MSIISLYAAYYSRCGLKGGDMYGKLFESMYDGTLADDWKALVTFQQMIVLATKDGVVDMTPRAIASRTGIPLEIIEQGIQFLEQPDARSRSPEMDGRRIARLDDHRPWGWFIVNYQKYCQLVSREQKRQRDRQSMREKRAHSTGYSGQITGEQCRYCGVPATGVSHITPISKGGKSDDDNCVSACNRCNSSKAHRDLIDFLNDSTTEIQSDIVLAEPKLQKLVSYQNGRFVARCIDEQKEKPNKIETVARCSDESHMSPHVDVNVDINNKLSGKPDAPPANTILYESIVAYLNKQASTHYKPTTPKTRDLIKARWNEGFREEDFKRVIHNMIADWGGSDWEKYLRPETLFGTKFESYLNRKPKKSREGSIYELTN